MSKLRYSDPALSDLREIQRYIARDKPDAARNWVAKIRRKCRTLAGNPELGDSREEYDAEVSLVTTRFSFEETVA
jgi:toxin ParE1/3/4